MIGRLSVLGLVVSCGLASTAYAQKAAGPGTTPAKARPRSLASIRLAATGADSGWVAGPRAGSGPQVIWSTTVVSARAPWLRVAFQDVQLSGDPATDRASYLLITSLADGSMQTLSARRLREWNSTSAYFNGDSVRVDLVAWPGAGPSRVVIDRAIAGTTPAGAGDSLCGPDDRVVSTDARVARVLTGGGGGICTAFLISDSAKCMLSAGHCAPGLGTVVEFNVPLSTSAGAIVHPPPESQFAVDPTSVQSISSGPGNDWAYFGVFSNANTGAGAAAWQGTSLGIGPAPAAGGQTLSLTGYGGVVAPILATWNQAQKRGTGAFFSMAGSTIQHQIDATPGDDGAPIRLASTGQAIGIQNGDGCEGAAATNSATAIQNGGLQSALAIPTGICARTINPPEPPLYITGDAARSLLTVNRGSGATGLVGQTGIQGEIRALAYDRGRQRFYASEDVQGGADRLYRIDRSTGAATLIGTVNGPMDVSGLAFDPNTDSLYGMDRGTGQLYRIDFSTAAATPIGAPSHPGLAEIDFDPARGVLYGIDNSVAARLVTIDPVSGVPTVVGTLGSGVVHAEGLAYCLDDGFLYSTDGSNGALLRIVPATGAAALAGPSGVQQSSGVGMACAYDCAPPCVPNSPIPADGSQQSPITQNVAWLGCANQKCFAMDVNPPQSVNLLQDILTATGGSTVIGPLTPGSAQLTAMTWNGEAMYALDLTTGNLVRLDTTTGAPTLVGATGITGWQGMASDANDNGQLYGITQTNSFYRINFFTGGATLVASNVGSLVTAMAMDRNSQLWGIEFVSGRILRINKDTGAFTVSATTIAGFQGMDFDDAGTPFAINSSGADKLYTVNLSTGVATLRGPTNTNTSTDMAFGPASFFAPPPPPPPPAPTGSADGAGTGLYDPTNLTQTAKIVIDYSKVIDPDHHGLPAGMTAVQGILYPSASAPILNPPPPAGGGQDAICGGTLINFDDIPGPCSFDLTTHLSYAYSARGVVFEGPGGNDGGAILNQCSGFGTTGGTGPNALVFSPTAALADGGLARGVETLRFTSPVSSVQASVGSATGGLITMQAYRGSTLVASRSLPLTAVMQPIGVLGSGITRVTVSFTGSLVLDDLCFVQSCPTTYDVYFGTTNPPTRILTSTVNTLFDPSSLASTTLYYWQIVAKNCCGQVTGPVWRFSTVCYANCDESTIPPVLNVNDFICFLNRFARGDSWANCDDSTIPPVLNVNDFVCFLNKYAAGCP